MPRSGPRKPRLRAGGRVLIMDDEPTILLTLGHYLQTLGAEVVSCRQFDAAAAALKAQRFDLVLADLRMSGANNTDGLRLLRLARQVAPKTRVVVMTGYGTEDARRQVLAHGGEYCTKPMDLDDLKALVR
ncbi:MAG: response regulator [Candidatus Methylomirabilales bacterium]